MRAFLYGLLGLVVLLACGLPRATYAQQAPGVTLDPTTAAPGEEVTVRGAGWPLGAALTARLIEAGVSGGPSASLSGPIPVGSDGTFAAALTVPRTLFGQGSRGNISVLPGSYTVVVNQDTIHQATAALTVGAPRAGGLLWGEVAVDTDGNDVRDARDQSIAAQVTVSGSSPDQPPVQALTDGLGRFVLSPLQPGAYHISASAQVHNQSWTASADVAVAEHMATRTDLLLRAPRPSGLPASLMAIEGTTLFVAVHDRVHAFDVADPRHPVQAGESPSLGADVRNLAVSGPRAAVLLTQGGVRILDVTDPRHLQVVSTYPTPSTTADVALLGSTLLVPEGNALTILDVSTPGQPGRIGAYQAGVDLRSATAAGRFAYVVTTDNRLRVVDLTDPAQPVALGETQVQGAGFLSPVILTHGNAFGTFIFGHVTQSVVFDVTDPTRPTRRTDANPSLYTTDEAFAPRGDALYVANRGLTGSGSLAVLAIADPARPVLVSSVQAPWNPLGIAIAGSWAYVLGQDDLLRVFDVGTPPLLRPMGLVALGPIPAAPPVEHDDRYFPETGYRIDDDAVWDHFLHRGALDTFGYPVSRTFTLLGCPVQMFQRAIAQHCADQGVQLLNVLDPDLFPYTHVNGSTFPESDASVKAATPKVDQPDYATAILEFVVAIAPDTVGEAPVAFGATFLSLITPEMAGTDDSGILGLLNLELWGAPTSHPAVDPHNADFIYQRFQRGIMHFDAATGVTRGILVADYLKSTLRAADLPPDLAEQVATSRLFDQYCRGTPGWLCRPDELPASDLTFAFEPG